MGDEKQYGEDAADTEDPGLAGAIDNATSEELAADDPRREHDGGRVGGPGHRPGP